MDWRYRRYFAVRLPWYAYQKYLQIIKAMPYVKVHPAKYAPSGMSDFADELKPRSYYHIMVSCLRSGPCIKLIITLDQMVREHDSFSSFHEIYPANIGAFMKSQSYRFEHNQKGRVHTDD